MPILKKGMFDDPDVAELQRKLQRLGFNLVDDSDFGPLTEQAVIDYKKKLNQRGIPIRVDGIADNKLMSYINADLGIRPSEVGPVSEIDWPMVAVITAVGVGLFFFIKK